ncbi:flagellar basal-body protein [Vibrio astriarenae]|uniref:Flagellar basal-body protein n=1 Tax=Vibrio astriarenae TaxID=1481923 RepID=A0A7Z2T495_9VIBR|nr:flagellar assembly protein FlgT [Vibrio astriarenae]QIA63937.1 flagellar basal-body protein [Vibrio astriarenae]
MKKIATYLLSTLCVVASALPASAAWYEVTGTATVVSSDEVARIHALEDAIYRAVGFAGADIGSISNLTPFLESNRKEYQFTGHEVRTILIEQQKVRGGVMQVKAKIDIYPSASTCRVDQYKKTFLIGNFDIASPQQAVMGQVYNLGRDFSEVISRQLGQESLSFVSLGTTNYEIGRTFPQRTKMIAEDTGAHYIVAGAITDLTATVDEKVFKDDIINRQFALEIQVYDGKTGHEIYQQNYREVARWPFSRTSQVDTRSARFWASTYGDMMLRLSRNIMLDLESELSCKMTLPQVVAKFGNNLTIDLGRVHGVEKGEQLQLWHTSSFIDQHGLPRNKVSQSNITVTVSRVYEQEAEVTVDQPDLAGAIQIGDVMHKEL